MSIKMIETVIDDMDGLPITETNQTTMITLSIEGNRKDFRDLNSFTAFGSKLIATNTAAGTTSPDTTVNPPSTVSTVVS